MGVLNGIHQNHQNLMYMLQIQTLCLSELFYGNVYMCAGKVGEFGEMLWDLHLKPK